MTSSPPFRVYDQVSFEIAKNYASWRNSIYFNIFRDPCHSRSCQWSPCKDLTRKCYICETPTDNLYLLESDTYTKREYNAKVWGHALDLVCFECGEASCAALEAVEDTDCGEFIGTEVIADALCGMKVLWSPDTHRFFHWDDIDTVETILLIANRANWSLPREIVWMILSYVFTLPEDIDEDEDFRTNWEGYLEWEGSYQELNSQFNNPDREEDSCFDVSSAMTKKK